MVSFSYKKHVKSKGCGVSYGRMSARHTVCWASRLSGITLSKNSFFLDVMPMSWMNNMNQDKRDQMMMAATPLPFYLNIESFYIDKKTKVTYYIIQIGIQVGVEMQITNLAIRYSQLYKLNKAIRFRLQNNVQTAKFPPKRIFGNKSLPFLKRRRDALQQYLKSLTNIPNIFECKEFMEIFHISPDVISTF